MTTAEIIISVGAAIVVGNICTDLVRKLIALAWKKKD